VLLLTDVYAAGEQPIEGAGSEELVQAIRLHGHHDVTYVPSRADLPEALRERVREGDIVLTLGAGDITHTAREFLALLSESR